VPLQLIAEQKTEDEYQLFAAAWRPATPLVSMAFHKQRLVASRTVQTSSVFAERCRAICLELQRIK